jgi:phosphoglycolate phosphatase-like HAD superfamily hydrolase
LFDLDGTLADTAADLTHALNHVLGEIGRATLAFEKTRPFVSRGARALIRLGLDTTDDDPHIEALLPRFLEYYARHLADETRLFPGIDEILGGLAARGIPWGVVTNKTRALTVPLLGRLGLSYPPAVTVWR